MLLLTSPRFAVVHPRALKVLGAMGLSAAIVGSLGASPAFAGSPAVPLITQYAGTGAGGAALPGPALSSPENTVGDVAVDAAGNVYIGDSGNQLVEKITPDGTLSIIAGNGTQGAPTPGPATSSALNDPYGIAVDAQGDVYIADTQNRVVEKVTPRGTLSIVAGDGTLGTPTAGPATSSHLAYPIGPRVDSNGNLYIADENNHVVEKVTPGGTLSIVAGNGVSGTPTPGAATASHLSTPDGTAVDSSGNLYIADAGNHVVEKVTPGGILSIVAGNGVNGAPTAGPATGSHLGNVTGVAVDGSGDLYISDSANSEVEEVTTDGSLSIVAGNGTAGAPTYGGPATSSHLHFPQGLDVSADGAIYIANTYNYTVDRVVLLPPADTSAPVISGTSATGATLSTDAGAWTNNPNTFAYQWQDCDSSGMNCVGITGATASTYTLTGSDAGHTLQVVVTASNAAGSGTATSNLSAAVPAAPTIPPPAPTTTATTTPTPTTTPTATATPTSVAVAVSVGAVPSAGITVTNKGRATLTLVCPATLAGCDASGVLIIHLPASLLEHSAMVAEQTASSGVGTVLASFSGRHIAGGHSALIAVQLKASVLRELQTLRIRRVKVTLTTSNHLTGAPAVNSSDVLYLQIPPLSAGACPVATGQLTATTIGPVTLDATQTRERDLLPGYTARNYHTDDFCLYHGSGIRVGYASAKLLGSVTAADHRAIMGRSVLALTANPYYTLDGIRPGSTLQDAKTKLKLEDGIHAGLNTWYLAAGQHNVWVLKVRGGIVQEIGTANTALTTTRAQQRALLSRF